MNTPDDLKSIFKRNRRLAELNPDVAAEVLAGSNSRIRGDSSRRKSRQADSSTKGVSASGVLKAANPEPLQPLSFTVPGTPVPKPRQTKRDKWAKRPCVLRYRAWADSARAACREAIGGRFPGLTKMQYDRVAAVMYFPIPPSWNRTTKEREKGQPHRLRPDIDNCGKAILDALYPTGDSTIYRLTLEKRWDDGQGPRTQITLY